MALDATVNSSSSDSYITVSDADAYHATHLYASTWTSAVDADKEKALKMATRILDEKIDWSGSRATSTQSLAWGRIGVLDDGQTVDSTVHPQAIKNATAEFARHLIAGDSTGNADGKGLTSLGVGSIALAFDKSDIPDVLPSIVQEMLRGWGVIHTRSSFGIVNLVRA
jgi:hypothetical protein